MHGETLKFLYGHFVRGKATGVRPRQNSIDEVLYGYSNMSASPAG